MPMCMSWTGGNSGFVFGIVVHWSAPPLPSPGTKH